MQLTVLGFQSPYPGPDGATPGYLLKTGQGVQLLLDCGSGVMSALARYTTADKLQALLLSHLHHDHLTDVFTLQYALHLAQVFGQCHRPLPVYAPQEPEAWWEKLRYGATTEPIPITEGKTVSIGDVSVTWHRTDHGIPCYAAVIRDGRRTILYGADSGTGTNWHAMCHAPDLFVCEATFLEHQIPKDPIPHLSARQAAEAAEAIEAKALLLTHFHPDNDPELIAREAKPLYSGKLHIAAKGYTIAL